MVVLIHDLLMTHHHQHETSNVDCSCCCVTRRGHLDNVQVGSIVVSLWDCRKWIFVFDDTILFPVNAF